jgi:hypothetical protein
MIKCNEKLCRGVLEGDDKCKQNFSHKTKEEYDMEYSGADEKSVLNYSFKGWNVT